MLYVGRSTSIQNYSDLVTIPFHEGDPYIRSSKSHPPVSPINPRINRFRPPKSRGGEPPARELKQAGRPTFFSAFSSPFRSPPLVNRSRVCYVAVNEVVVDKWTH